MGYFPLSPAVFPLFIFHLMSSFLKSVTFGMMNAKGTCSSSSGISGETAPRMKQLLPNESDCKEDTIFIAVFMVFLLSSWRRLSPSWHANESLFLQDMTLPGSLLRVLPLLRSLPARSIVKARARLGGVTWVELVKPSSLSGSLHRRRVIRRVSITLKRRFSTPVPAPLD